MSRPSPSLCLSLLALFVALGGTSYAAFSLPKNSVGTRQLRNNAVTTAKIKNHAVTGTKLDLDGVTVPSASFANSAADATFAAQADNASLAGNASNLGGIQPSGWQHAIQTVGAGGSSVGTIPGSSSSYVFAGSSLKLTTTASQEILASWSAVLAQTGGVSAAVNVAICAQPAGGGAIQPIPFQTSFETVDVSNNRIPYAVSSVGVLGAGTWKVAFCVENTSSHALDDDGNAIGWAAVV